MKTIKIDTRPFGTFHQVAAKAKVVAFEQNEIAEFEFNDITCFVHKTTNLDHLYRDYANSWTMEWKTVGPYCEENYSSEIQNELEKRNKINEEKRQKEQAEYRAKEEIQRKEFEAQVLGVDLELSDADGWNKSRSVNSDGYGGAALDYAEGWAKLMQIEIAKGKTIAECYDSSQKGLGFLGITGFQFGCAVGVLSQTWKHGEELRKVHNKKYGVTDEDKKGVVNPAILTIK